MNSQEDNLLTASTTVPPSSATLPVVEEDAAEGETAAAYQYCRDALGRQTVPGLLKCFGTNPRAARSMVDMGSAILFHDGHLSRRQKEMIATCVSGLNQCPYCLDSHGYFFTLQGASPETAIAVACGRLADADISTAERELLRFTTRVNSESFKITEDDVHALTICGWKAEQVAAAVHVTALMGMCNRIANAFGLASQQLAGFLDHHACFIPQIDDRE